LIQDYEYNIFISIRREPGFQKIVNDVEAKYQADQERVRKLMEEQSMLYEYRSKHVTW
jgi:hypothetical protein